LPPGDYSAFVKLSIPGVSGAAAKVAYGHPSFSISRQDVRQVFTSAAPQTPPPGVVASGGSSNPPWALIGFAAVGALLLGLLLYQLIRRRRGEPEDGATDIPRSTSAAAADATAPVASVVERTEPPPAPPPLPPEPAPFPKPVQAPPVPASPVAPAPPVAPAQHVQAQTSDQERDPEHFWEVAYDRGELGEDGVWRFPHRCRNCGLELMASDVADATAQADRS
jgi:hypothetical protein